MKRMSIAEIKEEMLREIEAVVSLCDKAFDDHNLNEFFRLKQRVNGLYYALTLLNGCPSYTCYQTGIEGQSNSHGAKYAGLVK
tara:strand:- start:395 stop:643 length:249 start_codon:yes stop_codon:yes gene_type:complete